MLPLSFTYEQRHFYLYSIAGAFEILEEEDEVGQFLFGHGGFQAFWHEREACVLVILNTGAEELPVGTIEEAESEMVGAFR